MKIATWNVNSVRARLPRIVPWLQQHQPDIVCMQETKVEDDKFPRELLEDEGYNIEIFGEKTYNGVATLARFPMEAVVKGFEDDPPDAAKRMLCCQVDDLVVVNLYVPNGQDLGTEAYDFKLGWLDRLRAFLDANYDPNDKVVLLGDFNITFDDRDVWDAEGMRDSIHCSAPEREKLAHVMGFGLTDAVRKFHEGPDVYTWWNYKAGGFQKNQGMRIDHMLMSASALESCQEITVDVEARRGRVPSDHAPVIAVLG